MSRYCVLTSEQYTALVSGYSGEMDVSPVMTLDTRVDTTRGNVAAKQLLRQGKDWVTLMSLLGCMPATHDGKPMAVTMGPSGMRILPPVVYRDPAIAEVSYKLYQCGIIVSWLMGHGGQVVPRGKTPAVAAYRVIRTLRHVMCNPSIRDRLTREDLDAIVSELRDYEVVMSAGLGQWMGDITTAVLAARDIPLVKVSRCYRQYDRARRSLKASQSPPVVTESE